MTLLGSLSTLKKSSSAALLAPNNLSDVADGGTSRLNLRVPSLATARCVATTNQALSGTPTIDGYAVQAGDVVLLTGQTTGSQNGPWIAASGAWTRPNEYPAGGTISTSKSIKISQGTLYKTTDWLCATQPVTVDTTAQTWQMVGSSYFQGLLTDGGSLQQWLPSTPTPAQSVWAYQGIIYFRLTGGTDSSFIRANWVEIGADPTTSGAGELASTRLVSTVTIATLAGAYTDVTGMTIAPIVPSNGRGVWLEANIQMSTDVACATYFLPYDVTAGAFAVDSGGTTVGVAMQYMATTGKTYGLNASWRLSPSAGSHQFQLRIRNQLVPSNVTIYGRNSQTETGMSAIAR